MRKTSPKLNRIVDKMEAKAEKNKAKVLRYAFWGLALFVAIPLPGTGAWTGCLIATLLRMNRKKAFFYGQLSGIVEPISGVLGALLILKIRYVLPFLLAFSLFL